MNFEYFEDPKIALKSKTAFIIKYTKLCDICSTSNLVYISFNSFNRLFSDLWIKVISRQLEIWNRFNPHKTSNQVFNAPFFCLYCLLFCLTHSSPNWTKLGATSSFRHDSFPYNLWPYLMIIKGDPLQVQIFFIL